jgi:hypothetical protein
MRLANNINWAVDAVEFQQALGDVESLFFLFIFDTAVAALWCFVCASVCTQAQKAATCVVRHYVTATHCGFSQRF